MVLCEYAKSLRAKLLGKFFEMSKSRLGISERAEELYKCKILTPPRLFNSEYYNTGAHKARIQFRVPQYLKCRTTRGFITGTTILEMLNNAGI